MNPPLRHAPDMPPKRRRQVPPDWRRFGALIGCRDLPGEVAHTPPPKLPRAKIGLLDGLASYRRRDSTAPRGVRPSVGNRSKGCACAGSYCVSSSAWAGLAPTPTIEGPAFNASRPRPWDRYGYSPLWHVKTRQESGSWTARFETPGRTRDFWYWPALRLMSLSLDQVTRSAPRAA